jgi:CBS-domain-containing membrane protein
VTARVLMNPRPIVLHPTDSLGKAAKLILEHHFRNIPVVDEGGRYLGVVGANCLLKTVLPRAVTMEHGLEEVSFIKDTLEDLRERWRETAERPVTDCLDTELETVAPDTPLTETLLSLYHNRTSLPVVDPTTGKLVGILSHWGVGNAIVGDRAP